MNLPDSSPLEHASTGGRLLALEHRLRLLLQHLAGRAILARTELDDLVQEVYLRAVTLPAGLPEPCPGEADLYALLARLARNVVVDVARSIRALKRDGRTLPLVRADWSRSGALAESQVLGLTPGPATRAAGAELHTRLFEAYRELEPDHRRVIGLRQFEGLSAQATGTRMGRSETAVHSLYRRALEAWDRAANDEN